MTLKSTIPPIKRNKTALRAIILSSSLVVLAACSPRGGYPLDWDLRTGATSTAGDARQATAMRPQADHNGVLSYPGYQMAQARRGDTVASVAHRLGQDPTSLARANALQPGDQLREGELLLLNSRVNAAPQPIANYQAPVANTGNGNGNIAAMSNSVFDRVDTQPLEPMVQTTPLPAANTAPIASAPAQQNSSIRPMAPPNTLQQPAATTPGGGKEPVRHVVQRGESASIIARRYSVTLKALAEWNNLGSDMGVRQGQTLIIPVATGTPPAAPVATNKPGTATPTPPPPSASKPLPNEVTSPEVKNVPKSPDMGSQRSAASNSQLAMPLSGSIIKAYDKRTNQGINIAGSPGAAIKSAEAGTVAAITKDTDQVQIVVIRHANSLLTVYAGVDKLTVNKGDSVKRGQQIGVLRAGSNPFLHFEVRKGVDSIDPMNYLQ